MRGFKQQRAQKPKQQTFAMNGQKTKKKKTKSIDWKIRALMILIAVVHDFNFFFHHLSFSMLFYDFLESLVFFTLSICNCWEDVEQVEQVGEKIGIYHVKLLMFIGKSFSIKIYILLFFFS